MTRGTIAPAKAKTSSSKPSSEKPALKKSTPAKSATSSATPPRAQAADSVKPVPFTSIGYDGFLAKLPAKDKLNVERHVTALEEDSDGNRASTWKRLASTLLTLAPVAPKAGGQQTMQFFIPDGPTGKYRMQVFALQDLRDGKLVLYTPGVLEAVVKSGMLTPAGRTSADGGADDEEGPPNTYRIAKSHDSLRIEELDGRTENLQPFFKDMVGWNRKALRITLPASATPAQVGAVETICAIAARKWTTA